MNIFRNKTSLFLLLNICIGLASNVFAATDAGKNNNTVKEISTAINNELNNAEKLTITGKVFNAKDNTPLENISVKVVGVKKGTTTKADGSFSISIEKGQSLEFSRVDMVSKVVKPTDAKELIVALQESDNNLSEVIVVAYNSSKRSSFTGSLATVKAATLESSPNASVQESIQGNVAGVQSSNGSGQPGSVPNIRVRGIGSINASATPLYVIDGIPVVSGDISGLNSNTIAGLNGNDIQSMTILKDASATSLYGSRAANGVVLITTKSGKAGKAKVSFTMQQGSNQYNIRDEQKTLNTSQYVQYYREGWANTGANPASYDSLLKANAIDTTVNTDWFNQVLRTGGYSQYNLNVSGGTDKTTYYISGSLYKSESPTKGINYNKGTYRMNMTSEISKRWSIKGGLAGSLQRSSNFLGGSFFANPIRAMYRLAPWLPVYKSDGVTYELGYNSGYNPVAVINTTNRNAKTYNIAANFSTKYKLADGLTLEGSYALDFNHALSSIYYDPRVGNAYVAVGGAIENYTQDITNWVATHILRYKKEFKGGHEVETFAGYEAQDRQDVDLNLIVNGIAPGTTTAAGGSSPVLTTGSGTGNRLESQPGQGSEFILSLPITLSVIRAVTVLVGGEGYAFPLARIERIVKVESASLKSMEGRLAFNLDDRSIGLLRANELFGLSQTTDSNSSSVVNVVVLGDIDNPCGLVVDQFMGEQDLVVRKLDPRLGKTPFVSSAAIDDEGRAILIMDVEDLLIGIRRGLSEGGVRGLDIASLRRNSSGRKRVLVVDDSITVREVERQMLTRLGYEVETAVDGVDGFTQLKAGRFDLLVTDVDMPRMNGIEFVKALRREPRFASLPVAIVSYKDRAEDRAAGMEAGANAYLTKGSFQDQSFIQTITDLIGEAQA